MTGLGNGPQPEECILGYLLLPGRRHHCIRWRPTRRQSGSVSVVHELLDVLRTQLDFLANGLMIRGAVAIGPIHAGPHDENRFSGPAVERARELDRSRDGCPRIVVDDEVVRRLKSAESLRMPDSILRSEMDVIDCMMATNEAGLHYIDYLHASFCHFDFDFDRYSEFLEHHKQIVEAGLAGTPDLGTSDSGTPDSGTSDSDTSLPETPDTYRWLKNYHNARIADDIARPGDNAFADDCDRALASTLAPLRIA